MKIIVTCGPSYEPIDQVRRISNFSTGRLGIALANALAMRGWEVICFKGEQATCPDPLRVHAAHLFSTNQNLADQLASLPEPERIGAVFHAAALCDFRVIRIVNEAGREISAPLASIGQLNLVLAPTIKLLPLLRDWFPRARIVGWKYELNGTQADALQKAWQQIQDNRTDACVLNGAAYGTGFGLCIPERGFKPLPDSAGLIGALSEWLNDFAMAKISSAPA